MKLMHFFLVLNQIPQSRDWVNRGLRSKESTHKLFALLNLVRTLIARGKTNSRMTHCARRRNFAMLLGVHVVCGTDGALH